MRRSVVVLAALTLALTGCAEQQPAAPPATSVPSVSASPPPSAPASAAPTPTTGTGGLLHLTVHHGAPPAGVRRGPAWEPLSTPNASSTSVLIGWTGAPSPGCGAVRDVWVRETSSSVVIDLVRSARAPGIMCPALLVPQRAEVPLPSALGSRVLQQDASSAGVQIAPSPVASPGTAG